MTDADDAGLVELTDRLREPVFEYVQGFGFALINEIARPDMCKAADLLESQRREIEELRRERDIANEAWKGTRCAELREQARAVKAEAALAEALKVIAPLAELSHLGDPRYDYDTLSEDTVIMVRLEDLRAASAFAAKHGGRDVKS